MTRRTHIALAFAAGFALSVLTTPEGHAQTAGGPAARVLHLGVPGERTGRHQAVQRPVESIFQPFGGRYIVRGGPFASLEGQPPQNCVVVIAFDSMEQAQAWYDSPAYRALRPTRDRSATSRVHIGEGAAPLENKP